MDDKNLLNYNGNTIHDMWVDFTFNENSGELAKLFDEDSIDEYIDNLNN